MKITIYTVVVTTIHNEEVRPFDNLDKAIEYVEGKFDELHCVFGRRRIYDSLKDVSLSNPYGKFRDDEFVAIVTVSQMEVSSRNHYDIFLDYERGLLERDITLSYKGNEDDIQKAVLDLEHLVYHDDQIDEVYHSLIDEVAEKNGLEHINYDDIYEFED